MKKRIHIAALVFGFALMATTASAQILAGSTTVSGANSMTITVKINTTTNTVEILATGPSAQWFGYGFGGSSMTNRYSLITEGTGTITERKLGNHTSGTLLANSMLASASTVSGSTRSIFVILPRVGATANHFTFPSTPGSITLIWAKGSGSALSQHNNSSRGSSLITLVDICNLPTTVLPSIAICEGQSAVIFGQTRTLAGTYSDTLTSVVGCDSTVSQQLIVNSVDTSVTAISNGLMANLANATYQWVNCFDNTPVANATAQTFNPTTAGDYKVILTKDGCTDTSACKNVILFSIDENVLAGVQVYPNPAANALTISLLNAEPYRVKLVNSVGQVLVDDVFAQPKTTLNLEKFSAGVYFVEVVQGTKSFRQKIVKN